MNPISKTQPQDKETAKLTAAVSSLLQQVHAQSKIIVRQNEQIRSINGRVAVLEQLLRRVQQ
jgi:hypothetical protein